MLMTRIALLGLGVMGSRMAGRLIDAGHVVTLWNRSAAATKAFQARATIAATPRAAAAGADIVLSMVRDDGAARRVWLDVETGALAGMATGAVAIESSTVTPGYAADFHAAAAARGIASLDAPVSGSLPQAESGQLVFLVGGAGDVLARVQPTLAAMGSTFHHVGPAGSGTRIKLAINALLAVQVAAAAELLGALARHDIPNARAVEVIGATAIASPALKNYMAGMAAGNFTPSFPVEMIAKDLGYAHIMAAGGEMPVTDAASIAFGNGIRAGLGAENMNAIVKLYR